MRRESFENFYYTKIGLAEGCGCAEHVTRMRDIDDLAAAGLLAAPRAARPGFVAWARTALRRLAGTAGDVASAAYRAIRI